MHTQHSKTITSHCLILRSPSINPDELRTSLTQSGFVCIETANRGEAMAILAAVGISLLVVECDDAHQESVELIRTVRSKWPKTAIVVLTCAGKLPLAARFINEGALDYLLLPIVPEDVAARVSVALEKHRMIAENNVYRTQLDERVMIQTRKYEDLFLAALQALADALEVKDSYTWGHSTRVSRYAMAIAGEMGLHQSVMEQLDIGSRLHDIGKIGVRETVLNKEGPLTNEEYEHVMEHPVIGWRLLAPLMRDMPHALAVVRSHHERVDGNGTPDRLCGQEIPIEARITAVADSFDAMTSGRPYRAGISIDEAVAELRRCAGTQFCIECVAAFERALDDASFPRPDWNVQRPTRGMQIVA